DEVEAIILSVNHDEKKVSLGIKQLYEDPWTYIPGRYPEETVLEVRVLGASDVGLYVELERGVEGMIPRTELDDPAQDPENVAKPGDVIKAKIVDVDVADRRITLSLKDAATLEVQDETMRYEATKPEIGAKRAGPTGASGATLGDVLKAKLGSIAPPEGEGDEESGEEEASSGEEE
ncbi:MAG: S1 RNA-binding domain-containing protein, partial [Myxococcota bacterium]